MALCKYCEGIDPEVIDPELNQGLYRRVGYDLQRSSSMRLSAQNGCSGCRFFLEVLRRGLNAKDVDDALQRDEQIRILRPFLLTVQLENGDARYCDLRLCLVQGTVLRSLPR